MKKKTTGSWTDWKGEVTEFPKLFLQEGVTNDFQDVDKTEYRWVLGSENIEPVEFNFEYIFPIPNEEPIIVKTGETLIEKIEERYEKEYNNRD